MLSSLETNSRRQGRTHPVKAPSSVGCLHRMRTLLLESEINLVMAKMIASGLETTAVHSHLLRASPEAFRNARGRP